MLGHRKAGQTVGQRRAEQDERNARRHMPHPEPRTFRNTPRSPSMSDKGNRYRDQDQSCEDKARVSAGVLFCRLSRPDAGASRISTARSLRLASLFGSLRRWPSSQSTPGSGRRARGRDGRSATRSSGRNEYPPFGIFGWGYPITAAGILFPEWGWFGVIAAAILMLAMTTKRLSIAAALLGGFWGLVRRKLDALPICLKGGWVSIHCSGVRPVTMPVMHNNSRRSLSPRRRRWTA